MAVSKVGSGGIIPISSAQNQVAKGSKFIYNKRTPFIVAALHNKLPRELIKLISIYAIEVLGGVYERPEWRQCWGVEIVEPVPPPPLDAVIKAHSGDMSKQLLLYMPQTIHVKGGNDKPFTFNTLKEINGVPFRCYEVVIEQQFGNTASPGWVLLDMDVIPKSRGQIYQIKEKMVKEKGGCMQSILEATVLNLMVFALTGKRLFGERTFTCCIEKVDGKHRVFVGGFNSLGLSVYPACIPDRRCGAACAFHLSHSQPPPSAL